MGWWGRALWGGRAAGRREYRLYGGAAQRCPACLPAVLAPEPWGCCSSPTALAPAAPSFLLRPRPCPTVPSDFASKYKFKSKILRILRQQKRTLTQEQPGADTQITHPGSCPDKTKPFRATAAALKSSYPAKPDLLRLCRPGWLCDTVQHQSHPLPSPDLDVTCRCLSAKTARLEGAASIYQLVLCIDFPPSPRA